MVAPRRRPTIFDVASRSCPYTALNSQVLAIRQRTHNGKFLCSTWHSCSSARRTTSTDSCLHELNTYYHTVCSYTIRHHCCTLNTPGLWRTAFLFHTVQQVRSYRRDRSQVWTLRLFHIDVQHSRSVDLSMTHRLTNNYANNYCNRTLIVKVIVENVVTCFLGHSVVPCRQRLHEHADRCGGRQVLWSLYPLGADELQ